MSCVFPLRRKKRSLTGERPKILALTASLLAVDTHADNLEGAIYALEQALCARVVTPSDDVYTGHGAKPREISIRCQLFEPIKSQPIARVGERRLRHTEGVKLQLIEWLRLKCVIVSSLRQELANFDAARMVADAIKNIVSVGMQLGPWGMQWVRTCCFLRNLQLNYFSSAFSTASHSMSTIARTPCL